MKQPQVTAILKANPRSMGYFRERARPALMGLLLGLVVGWCQPYILGVKPPATEARLFMTLQMGLAFTMIGLFLANYLEVRRRAIARYGKHGEGEAATSPGTRRR